jgi:hypothetical protein
MDWKKALKMVVGIPETAKGLSKLGVVPVGEEQAVDLPAGEVKLQYAESSRPPTDEGRMVFSVPDGLAVTVTSPGGDALEVKPARSVTIGSSPGPVAWKTLGTVDIAEPGSYRIAAGPLPPDRPEPRILLS